MDRYKELTGSSQNLYEFLMNSPLKDVDLEFYQDTAPMVLREIDL
jgi:hypothetical protein